MEAGCYHLSFNRTGNEITWLTQLVKDEQNATEDPSYKENWWFGNEMKEVIWSDSEYVQLQALKSVFSDGEHMTVYALMGLDTSKLSATGIDGDITVLLARTWDDRHNGSSALVTASDIPTGATLTYPGGTIVGSELTGFQYGDAMLRTPYGVSGLEIISGSDSNDLLILHAQMKDENNSTDEKVALSIGLLGVHMKVEAGARMSFTGSTLYDVPGMAQNATIGSGFGSWAVYWVESTQPAKRVDGSQAAQYFRLRAAMYDSKQDMMTKAYTLLTFDPEAVNAQVPVMGLHVYGDGEKTRVILELSNKEQEDSIDVKAFLFTETPSLSFERFTLNDPAVKPGEKVTIYFSVVNDGNVPLTGYRLNILDSGKVRAYMDYSFVTAKGTLLMSCDADTNGDGEDDFIQLDGVAAIHQYHGLYDERYVW